MMKICLAMARNGAKIKGFARGRLKKVRKTSSENAEEVFARRFFDFFWTASCETPAFETTLGRPWSENLLKSEWFVRGCPKKIQKTLRESAVQGQK